MSTPTLDRSQAPPCRHHRNNLNSWALYLIRRIENLAPRSLLDQSNGERAGQRCRPASTERSHGITPDYRRSCAAVRRRWILGSPPRSLVSERVVAGRGRRAIKLACKSPRSINGPIFPTKPFSAGAVPQFCETLQSGFLRGDGRDVAGHGDSGYSGLKHLAPGPTGLRKYLPAS
jgi:hypothetical protein